MFSCYWCLPERLSDRLSNKYSHLKVENISIGNHHESSAYAVKFTNGRQTVNMKGKYFYEEFDRLSPVYVTVGYNGDFIMME